MHNNLDSNSSESIKPKNAKPFRTLAEAIGTGTLILCAAGLGGNWPQTASPLEFDQSKQASKQASKLNRL